MASAIATPLEKQFSTIAGIDSMTSSSSLGTTKITLQFDLSRNIDGAAQDVQAAIARASAQLPPSMPTPPDLHKGESGGPAHPVSRHGFEDAAALHRGPVR